MDNSVNKLKIIKINKKNYRITNRLKIKPIKLFTNSNEYISQNTLSNIPYDDYKIIKVMNK